MRAEVNPTPTPAEAAHISLFYNPQSKDIGIYNDTGKCWDAWEVKFSLIFICYFS